MLLPEKWNQSPLMDQFETEYWYNLSKTAMLVLLPEKLVYFVQDGTCNISKGGGSARERHRREQDQTPHPRD